MTRILRHVVSRASENNSFDECISLANGLANVQVKSAANRLFEECSKRNTDQGGNLVYKLLPDIISHLMKDSTMINQPGRFEVIMTILLQHIKSEKHHVMLVSSLTERILHQTKPCSARMLLGCLKLLKSGISISKKIIQAVQQESSRLRWLLHDKEFALILKVCHMLDCFLGKRPKTIILWGSDRIQSSH